MGDSIQSLWSRGHRASPSHAACGSISEYLESRMEPSEHACRNDASLASSPAPVKQEVLGNEPMESPRDAAEPPRWNRDEHARFMQALETYGAERSGDEWHKIAAFVQTRSLEEVRLHGQEYLQHLVQIHQRQQQHRLLQLSHLGDPLQYPLTASRELQGNQNDPNGPNNALGARAKSSAFKESPSRLSVAAQSVANAMNAHILVRPSDAQPVAPPVAHAIPSTRNKLKTWTFHEDKVLETTLAAWQRGKPYSWPKIATALPGKTAKDVRMRYEQLVDDIASIDQSCGVPLEPTSLPPRIPPSVAATPARGRPPPHSGLSSRIAPPPPIQVPPPGVRAKGDSPGVFPPGSTRNSRFALTPSFGTVSGMLSPTFLDFLASEDRPPMPAFAGLTDLPSPLLPSPLGLSGHTPSGTRSRRSLVTPRSASATTPRIWHEFLADDFKFESKGPSPSASRPPTKSDATEASSSTTTSDDSTRRSDDRKPE